MLSEKDTKTAIALFQSIGNTNVIFPVSSMLSPGTKGFDYIIIVNPTEQRTCDMVVLNLRYATPDQLQQFEDHRHRIKGQSIKADGETEDGIITVLAFYNEQ